MLSHVANYRLISPKRKRKLRRMAKFLFGSTGWALQAVGFRPRSLACRQGGVLYLAPA